VCACSLRVGVRSVERGGAHGGPVSGDRGLRGACDECGKRRVRGQTVFLAHNPLEGSDRRVGFGGFGEHGAPGVWGGAGCATGVVINRWVELVFF